MTEKVKRFQEHGVHSCEVGGERVALLSAQSWHELVAQLSVLNRSVSVVVTPELITLTGLPRVDSVALHQKEIEHRVSRIVEWSKLNPAIKVLLGTPLFAEGFEKPFNGVLFIHNGIISGESRKRAGVNQAEMALFSFSADEPAALVPETLLSVLICADLSNFVLFQEEQDIRDRIFELLGRTSLIGVEEVHMIHPQAEHLVVLACWGSGGNAQLLKDSTQAEIDEYYWWALVRMAHVALKICPTLVSVLVCDRAPEWGAVGPVSSQPLNAVISR